MKEEKEEGKRWEKRILGKGKRWEEKIRRETLRREGRKRISERDMEEGKISEVRGVKIGEEGEDGRVQ